MFFGFMVIDVWDVCVCVCGVDCFCGFVGVFVFSWVRGVIFEFMGFCSYCRFFWGEVYDLCYLLIV